MRDLDLFDIEDQIKKMTEVNFGKLVNNDMLWKSGVMLKYVEENGINFDKLLDIGAGSSILSVYLILSRKFQYYGVEISKEENILEEWLDKNGYRYDNINYLVQNFLEFKTDEKFDMIIDLCSIIHFDPSTELSPNDGVYKSGLSIHSSLTDDGLFLCASDCQPDGIPNHKGQINKEYISPASLLKCYEMAGLELVQEPWFLGKDSINRVNCTGYFKPPMMYDDHHQDFYDRVFFVFRKKKS